MVWFDAFSYGTFYRAYRTERLYKEYIPSLITSIICLPISVIILINSSQYIVISMSTILLIVGSILLMMANLKFAHWLMHKFGKQHGEPE